MNGWIGAALPRKEDRRMLLGRGRFVGDLTRPGLLHAAFVRSPHAHALVNKIDGTAARRAPGVERLFTAESLGHPYLLATLEREEFVPTAMPILAGDKVRFVGEPVAMVIADDAYRAEDAAELVEVYWDPRPAVASMETATAAGAPRLHDHGNCLVDLLMFDDDRLPRIFAEAKTTVSATFSSARVAALPLEGRACLAEWDDRDDQLVMHVSTQVPHQVRSGVAQALDLAERSVRVIAPDVGGGFGLKCVVGREEVAVAAAALQAPAAPYRGVSRPQIVLVMERLMEKAAAALELGPLQVRRANLIGKDEFPYTGVNKITYDEGSYLQSLDLAEQIVTDKAWGAERDRLRTAGQRAGIGYACFSERTAYGTPTMSQRRMRMTPGYDTALVRMDPTGEVIVTTGTCGHGQGHETTFAQIVADRLGVHPGQVRLRQGDTDLASYGWGTWGSRSVVIGGGAAGRAADVVAGQLRRIAASQLEASPADIELVPAYRGRVRVVLTNKTPCGTYRAPGRFEGTAAREHLLDVAATQLGIDPIELRMRNLVRPSQMPHARPISTLGTDLILDTGDYPALLAAAVKEADRLGYRAHASAGAGPRGFGLAMFVEKSGLGPQETADVTVSRSGAVHVHSGGTSLGQGIETVLAQITADALGVDPRTVRVTAGDTAAQPFGAGSWASRSTVVGGSAVHQAALAVRERALRLAARMLEAAEEDLDLADGLVSVRGDPTICLSLAEIAKAAAPASRYLKEGEPAGLSARRRFEVSHMTYPYGAHAAVVEVDPGTGQVRVLRYLVAYEVGRAINPMLVEGQLRGGVAQGIGGALLEEFGYDEAGQPQAITFIEYRLPTAAEIPPVDVLLSQDAPSPGNPFGVMGAGEGGINAVGAAVANAVRDALGLAGGVGQLPLTPARVCALAQATRGPVTGGPVTGGTVTGGPVTGGRA